MQGVVSSYDVYYYYYYFNLQQLYLQTLHRKKYISFCFSSYFFLLRVFIFFFNGNLLIAVSINVIKTNCSHPIISCGPMMKKKILHFYTLGIGFKDTIWGSVESNNVYLRRALYRRMMFSRKVFCGATSPLLPPGILTSLPPARSERENFAHPDRRLAPGVPSAVHSFTQLEHSGIGRVRRPARAESCGHAEHRRRRRRSRVIQLGGRLCRADFGTRTRRQQRTPPTNDAEDAKFPRQGCREIRSPPSPSNH